MCWVGKSPTVESHVSRRSFLINAAAARTRFAAVDSSHSQTVNTRQPVALSALVFRASRRLFVSNFDFQNSLRVAGMRCFWQWCACQKHPWTNTTALYFGRTMSGRPGRSPRCRRKRNPLACRAFLTQTSGFVSRLWIRDIRSLRSAGVSESTI